MTVKVRSPRVEELLHRLDQAVADPDDEVRCREVARVLSDAVAEGQDFLADRFLAPVPDRYARRLLHRDPEGRYTVLIMVWNVGQGTALHDHGGTWCVECVYRGRIRVTSYSIRGGNPETGVVQFAEESQVFAGVGAAGALIPPFEYHRLENPDAEPAVTIHVYGGELTSCHVFEPVADGWRRRFRELSYTE